MAELGFKSRQTIQVCDIITFSSHSFGIWLFPNLNYPKYNYEPTSPKGKMNIIVKPQHLLNIFINFKRNLNKFDYYTVHTTLKVPNQL